MRPILALALVTGLLLSGCASDGDADTSLTTTVAGDDAGIPYVQERTPLRFATDDYEGNLTGQADFAIQEPCVFIGNADDCGAGERRIDLTPIVPPNAPVELVVKVYRANADLVFDEAFALGTDQEGYGEFDGQTSTFAPIVVRGDAGKVTLRVFNPGGFGPPPEPNPSVTYVATSVVRAGLLVPGVPATMRLQPGETLNLTSNAIDDVLLIAPDGTQARDDAAPFELTANGTAGDYTVLLRGREATPVYGPNVTMTARRLARVEDDARTLAPGTTDWVFPVAGIPVQVGMILRSAPPEAPVFAGSPTSFVTEFSLSITAPSGVVVLEATNDDFCGPFCGGGFEFTTYSAYLDEQLRAGDYAVSVTYSGNQVVAQTFATVIA